MFGGDLVLVDSGLIVYLCPQPVEVIVTDPQPGWKVAWVCEGRGRGRVRADVGGVRSKAKMECGGQRDALATTTYTLSVHT